MRALISALATLTLVFTAMAQVPCNVSISVDPPTCPMDFDGSISVTPNVPSMYWFMWAHDPSLDDGIALNLGVGTYTVTVFDTTGCFSQIEVDLPPPNLPPVGTLTTTDISCAGADDGTLTLTLNGPYNFMWMDNPSITETVRTGLGPGDYQVFVEGIPCPIILEASLGDPAVTIAVWGDTEYCPSDLPVLGAETWWGFDPDIYIWSTGDTTSWFVLEPGTEGVVEVTAIDTVIGCTNTASVTLTMLTPPWSTYHSPDTMCLGTASTAILLETNADSLVWRWGSEGFSNEPYPTILFDEPHWQPISLQSYDADGCGSVPLLDSVYVRPRLPATFTVEQIPCTPRIALHFESESDSCAFFVNDQLVLNQCWGFNEVDLERYNEYDFTFYSTQPNQCDDTASVRIDVRTVPTAFLPNAFTPNGDDINDTWPGPLDIPDLDYMVEIYDRWGHFVWGTTDTEEMWDGSDLPMGVYTYRMNMRDPCNETDEVQRNGFIMLFR